MLSRKTPMKRGAPMMRIVKKAPNPTGTSASLKRTAIKTKARPKHTKAEREHLGAVAALGCIACRNLGLGETPAQVHHIRTGQGGAQRASHFQTLPLCPFHHLDGGEGHAIHAGRESWEAIHGTELDLLAQVRRELNIEGASA